MTHRQKFLIGVVALFVTLIAALHMVPSNFSSLSGQSFKTLINQPYNGVCGSFNACTHECKCYQVQLDMGDGNMMDSEECQVEPMNPPLKSTDCGTPLSTCGYWMMDGQAENGQSYCQCTWFEDPEFCSSGNGGTNGGDPCDGKNCDDGNACTTDSCSNGTCINTAKDCEDGDLCTTNSCNATTGACETIPKDCFNGLCNIPNCNSATGACEYTPRSCDDSDSCTTDSCDDVTGCKNEKIISAQCNSCENEPVCPFKQNCTYGPPTKDADGCITACGQELSCTGCPWAILCAPIPEGCARDGKVGPDGCTLCTYTCGQAPDPNNCPTGENACPNDRYAANNPSCRVTGADDCGCNTYECVGFGSTVCCSEGVCLEVGGSPSVTYEEDPEKYLEEAKPTPPEGASCYSNSQECNQSCAPVLPKASSKSSAVSSGQSVQSAQSADTSDSSASSGAADTSDSSASGGTADTSDSSTSSIASLAANSAVSSQCLAISCAAPPAGCVYDITAKVEDCSCPPLKCDNASEGSSSNASQGCTQGGVCDATTSCADCIESCNRIDGPTDIVPKQLCLSGCYEAYGEGCTAAVCGNTDGAVLCGDVTRCCTGGGTCVQSDPVTSVLEGFSQEHKDQGLADCIASANENSALNPDACYFYTCTGGATNTSSAPSTEDAGSTSGGTTGGTTGGSTTGGGSDTGATGGSTGGTQEGSTGGTGGTGDHRPFSDSAICGDGQVNQAFEQCDDGNFIDYDGCSSVCQDEYRSPSTSGGATGQANNRPRDTRDYVSQAVCGDGSLQAGEQCDDSNNVSGDGCSATCRLESGTAPFCGDAILTIGESCDYGNINANKPNFCRTDCTAPICGDGIIDDRRDEQCDDGSANGLAPGACRPNCIMPYCGDGIHDPSEQCDDGNTRNGDGCSDTCNSEMPTLIATEPTIQSRCGNGQTDVGEECDDGNNTSNDGCSAQCVIEPWASPPEKKPDTLVAGLALCGNGVTEIPETCDDGNVRDNDGCNRYCEIEVQKEEDTKPSAPEDNLGTLVAGEFYGTDAMPVAPQFNGQLAYPGMTQVQAQQLQAQQYGFPQYPTTQQIPYQLPLAQLQPLIQSQGPAGETGPAAVAVIGAGSAAGLSWMRRRRR